MIPEGHPFVLLDSEDGRNVTVNQHYPDGKSYIQKEVLKSEKEFREYFAKKALKNLFVNDAHEISDIVPDSLADAVFNKHLYMEVEFKRPGERSL